MKVQMPPVAALRGASSAVQRGAQRWRVARRRAARQRRGSGAFYAARPMQEQ